MPLSVVTVESKPKNGKSVFSLLQDAPLDTYRRGVLDGLILAGFEIYRVVRPGKQDFGYRPRETK
jgi:hypothetical protein